MSEAKLHILKAWMLEGRMAKARRGELGRAVPMGYTRRASGEIILDADEQAQSTIRLVFDLYEQHHTIGGVLRHLAANGVELPVRAAGGAMKGELEWRRPNRPSLYCLLVNPIYAGAYVYGLRPSDRRRQRPGRPKSDRRAADLDNAHVVLHDHLPAYISWDRYFENRKQLQSNATKRRGPVRAGAALLSGLLICGRCGLRMTAAYNHNGRGPRCQCANMRSTYDEPLCQSLSAPPLDTPIGRLAMEAVQPAMEAVQPAALEIALSVAANLEAERIALRQHWQQRLERARYEAERARRQYDAVEPENRLVVRTLECTWETELSELGRLEAEHEKALRERPAAPTQAEITAIRAISKDLPALWLSDTTTQADRQTIVRLLLERVLVEVIGDSEQVRVECHWHGGIHTEHRIVRPVSCAKRLSTYAALVARASGLREAGLDGGEIAETLNRAGWRPAKRCDAFSGSMFRNLLRTAHPESPVSRLRHLAVEREPDEWTIPELARRLALPQSTINSWMRRGRLQDRSISGRSRPNRLALADAPPR